MVSSLFWEGGGSGFGGLYCLIFLDDWFLPLEKIQGVLLRSHEREREDGFDWKGCRLAASFFMVAWI